MDSQGVMGFPMRLTLAFVLLALCVPVLSEMTEGFRDGTEESEVAGEIGKITGAADEVYYGGTGTSAMVEIDITAGYEVVIGGTDADACSISVFREGGEISRTYLEHPSVRFVNDPLTVSGHGTLRLTCVSDDRGYGVEVSCP